MSRLKRFAVRAMVVLAVLAIVVGAVIITKPDDIAWCDVLPCGEEGVVAEAALPGDSTVRAELKPEEKPEFKRVYTTTVGDGFAIKIEMYNFLGRRMDSSELTQKNGKWILFNADAVADKIIDRDLYPLVQRSVDRILAVDKAFMATDPSEFMDKTGVTWRRVKK